jgi:hypothetical protein
MHSSTNGPYLATCEPLQSELLPCDDFSWNQGLIGTNLPLFASPPTTSYPHGQFATVCRAAHVLSRVMRHKHDQILEFPDRLSEAIQLNRALVSLDSSFADGPTANGLRQCDLSRVICYSARLILYNIYASNDLSLPSFFAFFFAFVAFSFAFPPAPVSSSGGHRSGSTM